MLKIEEVMTSLSKIRPIFRSEKDFQDALQEEIKTKVPHCEKNKIVNGIKVDLWWVENGKEVSVQLRHKTKKLAVTLNGESFELKNHGAQDLGRYDYVKDLQSLEKLCLENPFRMGVAILLTNDHLYWQTPVKNKSVDEDFLLYEGNRLTGECRWKEEASLGTTKGREEPILLRSKYKMCWSDYSIFAESHSEFRFLCVGVK